MGAFQRNIVTTGETRGRGRNILRAFSYLDILQGKAKTEYAKLQ